MDSGWVGVQSLAGLVTAYCLEIPDSIWMVTHRSQKSSITLRSRQSSCAASSGLIVIVELTIAQHVGCNVFGTQTVQPTTFRNKMEVLPCP